MESGYDYKHYTQHFPHFHLETYAYSALLSSLRIFQIAIKWEISRRPSQSYKFYMDVILRIDVWVLDLFYTRQIYRGSSRCRHINILGIRDELFDIIDRPITAQYDKREHTISILAKCHRQSQWWWFIFFTIIVDKFYANFFLRIL